MDFNTDKAVDVFKRKTSLFPVENTIFMEHVKPPMRILDLGCGTGRTTRHLKDAGHHVTGVDISPLMTQQAKKLHPDISFRVADARNTGFMENTFDAVLFSFNGLDYLYPEEDRFTALVEICYILKPGGIFIYSSHERRDIHKGEYIREKMRYGELVTYYGTVPSNHHDLRLAGFKRSVHYDLHGKGWRYYVAWA